MVSLIFPSTFEGKPSNTIRFFIMQTTEKISLIPPSRPGEWSLAQIQEALKRPLPESYLKRLKDKGNALYLPWWRVCSILDKYCPGWTWEIRDIQLSSDRIFMIGRLTIPTSEGNIYREASGTAELKRQKFNEETGELEIKELAYGDPSSNAESMCFRRAVAKFGLALSLYEKK